MKPSPPPLKSKVFSVLVRSMCNLPSWQINEGDAFLLPRINFFPLCRFLADDMQSADELLPVQGTNSGSVSLDAKSTVFVL